jgi:hypothetical protein
MLGPFLVVLAFVVVIGLPLTALLVALAARRRAQELAERVRALEVEFTREQGERRIRGIAPAPAEARGNPSSAPPLPVAPAPAASTVPPVVASGRPAPSALPPVASEAPPPLPALTSAPPPLPAEVSPAVGTRRQPAAAGPMPAATTPSPAATPAPAAAFDWEQFMGVKLVAWLGGLALFLGLVFLVKYSFEHDLVPPGVRVLLGFATGLGLVGGGLALRRRYETTAHTLAATGVVTLYAVTFAGRTLYELSWLAPWPASLVLALITGGAFVLAVRWPAQPVAVLGMVGGFLTPLVVSTGEDHPVALFTYLAALDVGLAAVALRRGWSHLVALGAVGTAMLMVGWLERFHTSETGGAAVVVAGAFATLFVGILAVARWRAAAAGGIAIAAAGMGALALAVAGWLALEGSPGSVATPAGWLALLAWANGAVVAVSVLAPRYGPLQGLAAVVSFALLGWWLARLPPEGPVGWALGAVLGFAALHTAVPAWRARRDPGSGAARWVHGVPLLALLLVLFALGSAAELSWLLWPLVLALALLAWSLAALTAAVAPLLGALLLTLAIVGGWVLRTPAEALGVGGPVALTLLFATGFGLGSVWLLQRLPGTGAEAHAGPAARWAAAVPALSGLLPFVLLAMLAVRSAGDQPSLVFGAGLVLMLALGALAVRPGSGGLAPVALIAAVGLQAAWAGQGHVSTVPGVALGWAVAFAAVAWVGPFLGRRRWLGVQPLWAASALAWPLHFPLLREAMAAGWPGVPAGVVAAVAAVFPLAGLVWLHRALPEGMPWRLNRLAWFGGATLFLVTLILPLELSRHWLTLGWALEGAALLWLFRRLPHPGLRVVGVGLLVIVFVRLSLNPAVLVDGVRGERPLLNWMLLTYGTAVACLWTGAALLTPPRDRLAGVSMPALLGTLGTVLAFLLVNLQIADWFTPPGAPLQLEFSGNFGRDMSYTIAWAAFALALIGAGLWRRWRAVRLAALALLGVALAKLFLHDLATLGPLHRIAALVAVALIAIVSSWLYQRFARALVPAEPGVPPDQAGAA